METQEPSARQALSIIDQTHAAGAEILVGKAAEGLYLKATALKGPPPPPPILEAGDRRFDRPLGAARYGGLRSVVRRPPVLPKEVEWNSDSFAISSWWRRRAM